MSNGWRLPTMKEMRTIIDYGKYGIAFRSEFIAPPDPAYIFWLADEKSSSRAWIMKADGSTHYDNKRHKRFVWPVRG